MSKKKQQNKNNEVLSEDISTNLKGSAYRLFRELFKQKAKMITIIFSALFGSVLSVSGPIIIGDMINTLVNGIENYGNLFEVNFATMGRFLVILLVIYTASALFGYLQQFIMASVGEKLTLSLRRQVNQKLGKLPLSYYDHTKKGEILSRVTNDLEKVSEVMQNGLMQFISSVITIIGAIILMFVINPILAAVAITIIFMSSLITKKIAAKSQIYFAKSQEAIGEMNGLVEEMYSGNAVIKAFNKEEDTFEKVKIVSEKQYEANLKSQFVTFAINPAIRLFNQLGFVASAILGGIFVVNGYLTLGAVQAFFQYINMASEPITEAAYVANSMQAAIAGAERVFQVLDQTEELPDKKITKHLEHPRGEVIFDHVRFGYYPDHILMEDVSFTIAPGEKAAIVGPTGAGKTTLVNLLMRFYELNGGSIFIDGVDSRDFKRSELRKLFGMVLQDTWLFDGTIADNIAYGRNDASREEIVEAAKLARCDYFIRTLPDGYDTILSDEDANISQGQQQLLTIARVFLADPDILILDEATSSVDTRTEVEIQKAMSRLMENRTTFVIAHRLSTIRDAHHILVMDKGSIIEQGTHEELLSQKTFYADLYNSQFTTEMAS